MLTVGAVLQECPGQGLRTRGDEGQEGNLGSGGQRQPPYWELHSSHGARVTGCLEAMAAPTSRCLSPAAVLAAGEPPSPALPRWLTGSLVPGPRREQTGSLGTGPGWNHLRHSQSDWPCCLLAAGLRQGALCLNRGGFLCIAGTMMSSNDAGILWGPLCSYSTSISSINYRPVGICSFRVHGSIWVPSSVWIPVLAPGMQPVWLDLSPTASEPAGLMVRTVSTQTCSGLGSDIWS